MYIYFKCHYLVPAILGFSSFELDIQLSTGKCITCTEIDFPKWKIYLTRVTGDLILERCDINLQTFVLHGSTLYYFVHYYKPEERVISLNVQGISELKKKNYWKYGVLQIVKFHLLSVNTGPFSIGTGAEIRPSIKDWKIPVKSIDCDLELKLLPKSGAFTEQSIRKGVNYCNSHSCILTVSCSIIFVV